MTCVKAGFIVYIASLLWLLPISNYWRLHTSKASSPKWCHCMLKEETVSAFLFSFEQLNQQIEVSVVVFGSLMPSQYLYAPERDAITAGPNRSSRCENKMLRP